MNLVPVTVYPMFLMVFDMGEISNMGKGKLCPRTGHEGSDGGVEV
jgi:hypothetical protein